MKRLVPLTLLISVITSGCATMEQRDCSIVPAAFANEFGSNEGYLAFTQTMRRPSDNFNNLKIKLSTEYLDRQDTTDAGRLHFLQTRARAYAATGQRSLALADYITLSTMQSIEAKRRAYFAGLVETRDFPLGQKVEPDPENVVDAAPIVRIPPRIPQSFLNGNNSGHCTMLFDVDTTGNTTNIRIDYCTNNDLREASINSLQIWKYTPKIVSGKAVLRKDVKTRISFNIQDECGYYLPE